MSLFNLSDFSKKLGCPNENKHFKKNWNTYFQPKKLSEVFLQVNSIQVALGQTNSNTCVCTRRPLFQGPHLSIVTNQHQQLFRLHMPVTKPQWAGQTNQSFFQDNSHTSLIWITSLYPFWCISLQEIILNSLPSWDNLPAEAILIEKSSAWSLSLTFYHPFRKPPLPFTSTLHICTCLRDSSWGGTEHTAQGQKAWDSPSPCILFYPLWPWMRSKPSQIATCHHSPAAVSAERFNSPQGPLSILMPELPSNTPKFSFCPLLPTSALHGSPCALHVCHFVSEGFSWTIFWPSHRPTFVTLEPLLKCPLQCPFCCSSPEGMWTLPGG